MFMKRRERPGKGNVFNFLTTECDLGKVEEKTSRKANLSKGNDGERTGWENELKEGDYILSSHQTGVWSDGFSIPRGVRSTAAVISRSAA